MVKSIKLNYKSSYIGSGALSQTITLGCKLQANADFTGSVEAAEFSYFHLLFHIIPEVVSKVGSSHILYYDIHDLLFGPIGNTLRKEN